jgi:hypothetical protein
VTNCRKAIADYGILLIRDSVLPEGDAPSPAKQMDITMLIMTGGHERSEEEWRTLLAASGFSLREVYRTSSPFDLIEADPVRTTESCFASRAIGTHGTLRLRCWRPGYSDPGATAGSPRPCWACR